MWLRTVQVTNTNTPALSQFLLVCCWFWIIVHGWKSPLAFFFSHHTFMHCSVQRGCDASVWPVAKPDDLWSRPPILAICHHTGAGTAGRRVPQSILHRMCQGVNVHCLSVLWSPHYFSLKVKALPLHLCLNSCWRYLSSSSEHPKAGLLHRDHRWETQALTLLCWLPR